MSARIHYLRIGAVLAVLVPLGLVTVVGRDRIGTVRENARTRLLDVLPHIGLLGCVMLFNRFYRPISGDLSWTIHSVVDNNITDTLYTIEGQFVAWIQSIATVELTWAFSLVYVFGYAFMLVFPIIAYSFLDDLRMFRVATIAYAMNYLGGLVCYSLFISYGPRNYMPGDVQSLIYIVWPEIEALTTSVNTNTNVFPSLHASLALTVALLAWYSRDEYPRWLYVAGPLAMAVVFSTMYLGLHWATDGVAGAVLAVLSVAVGFRLAAEETDQSRVTALGRRILSSIHRLLVTLFRSIRQTTG